MHPFSHHRHHRSQEGKTMFAHIIGILFLAAGAVVGVAILMAALGILVGLVTFAVKLAVPILLIYLGYRLVTRDRNAVAY
jgi:hypothetical protein